MADISGITSMLFDWLLSPLIWFALIFVFLAATFGFLWIRKRRKLIYNCIEVVKYKDERVGLNSLKAGWFGKNKYLKRWYDNGEEQLETQDGEKIHNFSTEDFQEINGGRGIIIMRDPINPDILVPISRVSIKGMEMLAEIAPGEYRDAAADIINDVDKETKDRTMQIVQWIMLAGVIIFALVSIIVIAQMVKQGQKEAGDLIIQAGETCLTNAKEVCSKIATSVGSAAP